MNDTPASILQRADERQREAREIIERLGLLERWAKAGQPVLVGAVSYGLAVRPDIDLEIYGDRPRIEDGFAVVTELALVPGVWKIRFSNELDGPNHGLYWQVRYRNPALTAPEVWKIDMWLLPRDYDGPTSRDLALAMRQALTPETRASILLIKEATVADERIHGIDVYRAVLDGGIRSVGKFERWFADHGNAELSDWKPAVRTR